VQSFEQIRSHLGARHQLKTNDPYLISFDLALRDGRHQGIYLAELEDDGGGKLVRISTPVSPYAQVDPTRCLRFNWQQRSGYLAVSDLAGSPYLHLCENRWYGQFDAGELERLILELGKLGDHIEDTISRGGDIF